MKYTAWMWRTEANPGAEVREREVDSFAEAKLQLTKWMSEWPESFEYGIDHEDADGVPVADFLSDAIIDRMKTIGAKEL